MLVYHCMFFMSGTVQGDWEKHLLVNFFFLEIVWLLLLAGGIQK